MLFIVSGLPGPEKALSQKAVGIFDDMGFSVSNTTTSRTLEEINGVDYIFVDDSALRRRD